MTITMETENLLSGGVNKIVDLLNDGYEKISEVLSVILDIAYQTNMVALNASIEAARLGDGGKGFSIIAEEIRKLSGDSKESAAMIKQFLENMKSDTQSIFELKKAYEGEKFLLDALLNSSEDRIFFKDLDLKFTRVSRSTLEYHQRVHGVDDLIGKSDFDFYPEEEATIYSNSEKELFKGGTKAADHVNSETLADGSVNYYLTTKFPLYDSNGKLCGLFGISKNITELQKKLQAGPETEEQGDNTEGG